MDRRPIPDQSEAGVRIKVLKGVFPRKTRICIVDLKARKRLHNRHRELLTRKVPQSYLFI